MMISISYFPFLIPDVYHREHYRSDSLREWRNKYCGFYGAFSLKPDNVRNRRATMPNRLHGFNKMTPEFQSLS